jgi:hypothetical protein
MSTSQLLGFAVPAGFWAMVMDDLIIAGLLSYVFCTQTAQKEGFFTFFGVADGFVWIFRFSTHIRI